MPHGEPTRVQHFIRATLVTSGLRWVPALLAGLHMGSPALGLAGQAARVDAATTAEPMRVAATEPLRPDTVLDPPGGPRLIRLPAPSSGLTALRLSIPVEEAAVEAGAAAILHMLGLEQARAAARPLGVRVEGSRTPWDIAYTVVGPSEEFDYLAYVLRQAVAEPRPGRVELERARARAIAEADRVMETPAGRLAAELRAAVVAAAPPLEGTTMGLESVTETTLRDLWRRTYRPEAMSVVLVGGEPVEFLLASLREIGSGTGTGGAPATDRGLAEPQLPQPEVLRQWYGEARVAGDVTDPHGAVLALLVSRRLREPQDGFESSVQLWDIGGTRVLVVTGAAYPSDAAAMRRRVQGVLGEATANIGAQMLAPVLAALRFELLAAVRTPWGLAAHAGRYHDATGEPEAAYRYVLALDRVSPESLQRYVNELTRRPVVRAEVEP